MTQSDLLTLLISVVGAIQAIGVAYLIGGPGRRTKRLQKGQDQIHGLVNSNLTAVKLQVEALKAEVLALRGMVLKAGIATVAELPPSIMPAVPPL